MLFNSYEFIFFFLPVVLAGFFALGTRGKARAAVGFLVVSSLFYYGWWDPTYLLLILASIGVNYRLGAALSRAREDGADGVRRGRWLLRLGVALNLGALGWFKYANFVVDNVNSALGSDVHLAKIVLPLAISFFTFQQIAYLVDSHRGEAREHRFLHYCLFVTFFPQLIAGPIVHHGEMLPQFADGKTYRFRAENLSVGATVFFIGLFKKVVFADTIAQYGSPVFEAAADGVPMTFLPAWAGALAYTLQIYFDFSGYSDMAIGLGRMFGVRLPLNFHSPYKAVNIIDFWRRWHMTLSRFLRDYLYIPLGGNRNGKLKRYRNLFLTMLLGGMWHGAGWTFLVWGTLHGVYLMINHAWHGVRRALGFPDGSLGWFGRGLSRALTFLVVVIAWVFFRAESLDAAVDMLVAMSGANGVALPGAFFGRLNQFFGLGDALTSLGVTFETLTLFKGGTQGVLTLAMLLFALVMPNTQQFMDYCQPALDTYRFGPVPRWVRRLGWRPNIAWAGFVATLAMLAIFGLSQVTEFLYFQF